MRGPFWHWPAEGKTSKVVKRRRRRKERNILSVGIPYQGTGKKVHDEKKGWPFGMKLNTATSLGLGKAPLSETPWWPKRET